MVLLPECSSAHKMASWTSHRVTRWLGVGMAALWLLGGCQNGTLDAKQLDLQWRSAIEWLTPGWMRPAEGPKAPGLQAPSARAGPIGERDAQAALPAPIGPPPQVLATALPQAPPSGGGTPPSPQLLQLRHPGLGSWAVQRMARSMPLRRSCWSGYSALLTSRRCASPYS